MSQIIPRGLALRADVLRALRPEERRPTLLAALRQEVAGTLRTPVAQVDLEQPLGTLGLDSLAAVDLQHRLEKGLGISVPLDELLQGQNLEELGRQLLDALEGAGEWPARQPLARTPEAAEPFALSHGQSALWFLHRLAPESRAYHIPVALRVRPAVDAEALRRALAALIERHGALRTTFQEADGEIRQSPLEELAPEFLVEDASDSGTAALERRLEEESSRSFDLATGPLVRLVVFRRSTSEDVVLLVVHHIVADFWSMAVMARELGALYRRETQGGGESLDPVGWTYADYVAWERQRLTGPEGERLFRYWRRELGESSPVLELATDRPRPSVQTYRGSAVARELNADLTARVEALARRHGATLHTTLLAVFQALLHRYSGQPEVRVGSPSSGRERAEFAGVVGYFTGPLVLRAELGGRPTFRAFLNQVRRRMLDALAHAGYPFPLLVERLQKEPDPSRSPLFQAVFVLHQSPPGSPTDLVPFALGESGGQLDLGTWRAESMAVPERASQFDLTLRLGEVGGRLRASLQFNTDLFDRSTAVRLLSHYRELLSSAVADVDRPIDRLELLVPSERRQLLVEWNATASGRARVGSAGATVRDLFDAEARRSPEATAVAFGDSCTSYRELARRANQLGHYLSQLGVGPDKVVALCLERSPEFVVAALAALEAGGAYLPLDPAYPAERLAFMVSDAGAPVVVTSAPLAATLPELPARVVEIDVEAAAISAQSPVSPGRAVGSGHLAYVIYTSGSTGRPKGVEVSHGALMNLVTWHRERFAVTPGDRSTLLSGLAFDAAVWDLWPYLSSGASVHLPEEAARTSPVELRDWLLASRITVSFAPTPLAEQLLALPWPAEAALRNLLTGGDRLRVSPPLGLPFVLFNDYGPTENAVVATSEPVPASQGVTSARSRLPSIGRPIAGVAVYLLGRGPSPVPAGVAGELVIGGSSLARGYRCRPGLTAERFVPDPLSGAAGGRLYRTGDLARFTPTGEIEFLGRLDHQVKVRGVRIELGEIEAVLAEHPAVAEAVAGVRDDASRGGGLVAYVAASGAREITAGALRSYLVAKLPEAMVPPFYVFVDELPLTPNGKIDRAALSRLPLPEPEAAGSRGSEASMSARTAVEEILAGIFAEVLEVERPGVGENFFHLGGHSLLATRLVSRVREVLGVELAVRSVFESPTVAALAARVESDRVESERRDRPRLQALAPASREGPLPLSFAQQRMWFLAQLEPESAAYNVPGAVRLVGQLDGEGLELAIGALIRRHETLRTSFRAAGGVPVQVIAPAASFNVPWIDLRGLASPVRDSEVRRRMKEEARRPFDLALGALLRVTVFQLAEEEHVLAVTLHHVISDGWSLGVLLRELGQLYGACHEGRPVSLPELPVQYADYAVWQRHALTGPFLEAELSYWKEQLAGMPTVLDLPGDRPRPARPGSGAAEQTLLLSPDLLAALERRSRSSAVTLFMTLLASFQALMARYTGQTDLAIGSPIAGRTQSRTEGLIGLFVNTLALRARLGDDPRIEDFLVRVRETTLSAYEHQELPFEKLVEELAPDRDLARMPLVQVMLVLQTAPRRELELPGLEVESLAVSAGAAKLDLLLTLEEAKEGLRCSAETPRELYDTTTISRLLRHYEALLAAVADDPSRPWSSLPRLLPSESHQLSVEWIDTPGAPDATACLDQLFSEQAARTPEAEALVAGGERLSYAELEERTNHVAHVLRRHGVGPEVRVGVCLERTADLVVSLLAVLKAGGAYVPLDPAYPRARRDFMLADSGARLVLARRPISGVAFTLDPATAGTRSPAPSPPPRSARPRNLAYVIYTSGSTGRPKGVAIEHRSAAELVRWARHVFAPEELSGVVAATSISFDLSIFEIFVPLACGGRVILAENALALPELAAEEVTLINTVPSAMSVLAEGRLPSSLRTVNLAGEPLPARLVDRIYAQDAVRGVWNLYGPSEDTTYSTCVRVPPRSRRTPPERVTIGRPVSGGRGHVLDPHLSPLPIGVSGELCLGGTGLSRGYLDRPGLTAERFVPDPYGAVGERLYKSGDLVRWLPGGEIDFQGRIDHQVKIRGFRIELGEIEALIARHAAVREAVVVAREARVGDPCLVAYVVGRDRSPAAEELESHLRQELPAHMIPSAFVFLDSLPATPSGKVDRQSLPAPEEPRERAFTAPRTPVEETVAGMFADVLGLERIGVREDFFKLGGHSLLATRLVSQVRETFRVELPLRSLFESPTVEELAAALVVHEATPGHSERVARMLQRIHSMSSDELQAVLADSREQRS